MRPQYEQYTITSMSYNDIYDRYITIAESSFGSRIQWWQEEKPIYETGDVFVIRYDLEAD